MKYELKCDSCKKKLTLDISLSMYEECKPHKCKCGKGILQRDFRTTVAIRTTSSPSRY
jgi:hypothetical protein